MKVCILCCVCVLNRYVFNQLLYCFCSDNVPAYKELQFLNARFDCDSASPNTDTPTGVTTDVDPVDITDPNQQPSAEPQPLTNAPQGVENTFDTSFTDATTLHTPAANAPTSSKSNSNSLLTVILIVVGAAVACLVCIVLPIVIYVVLAFRRKRSVPKSTKLRDYYDP